MHICASTAVCHTNNNCCFFLYSVQRHIFLNCHSINHWKLHWKLAAPQGIQGSGRLIDWIHCETELSPQQDYHVSANERCKDWMHLCDNKIFNLLDVISWLAELLKPCHSNSLFRVDELVWPVCLRLSTYISCEFSCTTARYHCCTQGHSFSHSAYVVWDIKEQML